MKASRVFVLPAMGLLAAAMVSLSGCAVLALGGAVGSALVATDRRTAGVQLEDQSIEFKANARVREVAANRGNVNITSYNRMVLITGEVAGETERTAVEQAVARIENVRSTVNELAVMGASSFTSRSNDVLLTSKVKASYVDAKDLQSNAIKVVTERATVYLMGRVTEREADRAAEIARSVPGVQKVVKVFDILTDAELAALGSDPKR